MPSTAITTFVQVNVRKTTPNFSGSITPQITINGTTFQGSTVKFHAVFPVNTLLSSVGHTEKLDVSEGDTITIDLGNGHTCSGTVRDPNGLNVVECTI